VGHGNAAEIAIDPEDRGVAGWVRVEEIGAGAVLQRHGDEFPGLPAIRQPGQKG